MIFQLQDLDRYTQLLLPEGCQECGWWQGYDLGWPGGREASAWHEAALEGFGSWGKLALADDQLLGFIQFGPAGLFRRSKNIPAAPVSDNAVLLTCGSVAGGALQTVMKSLLTAVMAELRQRGVEALEAFCLEEDAAGENCRFFEQAFLRECGFYPLRTRKAMKLMRMDLKAAQPVKFRKAPRRGLLERIKSRSASPAPVAMAEALKACSAPACTRDG